ncbi:MAG TPA: MFS transporter, partial [Thermoplasmata archaeon]|nr:MFS transporter [Thermoplasmata archaeon]
MAAGEVPKETATPAHLLPLTVFILFSSTAVYFAGTAVAPALVVEWALDLNAAAALTWAVQAGFIVGTLATAALNLPDRFAPQKLIAALLVLAAAANLAFTLTSGNITAAILLRFAAGALAGPVYPIGMRVLATWYPRLGFE